MPQIIIDRKYEQELFRKLISGETKQNILFVSGQSGMGKSVLLRLFREICVENDIETVSFSFRGGSLDFSEFATRTINILGEQNFPNFQVQINSLVSKSISVDKSVILDSRKIQFSLAGFSSEKRRENQKLVTDAIFVDLTNLVQEKPIAIFFDTYEQADSEFKEWLNHNFIINASRLRNLIIVIAGQQIPKIDSEWQSSFLEIKLEPIKAEYWISYAEQLALSVPDDFISGATTALKGNPLQMAMLLSALNTREGGNDF